MSQLSEKLEGLLLAEAMELARQHQEAGQQASEKILLEATAKHQSLLDGEEERFQLQAQQHCRQLLQSASLKLNAEQDRLRWALAQDALSIVRTQLQTVTADSARYRTVLGHFLKEAAQAIPDGTLVAEMRPHDIENLRDDWAGFVHEFAPGRSVVLSPLKDLASGGMLVRNEDSTLRVNNTFEGRMARMENALLDRIMHILFTEREAGA